MRVAAEPAPGKGKNMAGFGHPVPECVKAAAVHASRVAATHRPESHSIANPESLILGADALRGMRAAGLPGRPAEDGARAGAATAAKSAPAGGVAEFREMFVSLVDPAGLLDMEACRRTVASMEEAALRSGYEAGARMASILSDMFAAADDIAGRPVVDGSLGHTGVAHGFMMSVLYYTAEAYRDGRDAEPIGELENARAAIEIQRSKANRYREQLRAAGGPPGASLPWIERMHVGKVCRDVEREGQEMVRARQRERGYDPVFPPKAKTPREICGECADGISGTAILEMMRGDIPDGYELVRVDKGGRQ